ncbi:hypothetical protein FISHEDRAFT_75954 [Fistulina hepatica ATCC 64428]|uniref:Uncharacterized protein n=1 Tax=Fistulina hepatica ATCC 64428 TaxID=1128425 RepID=A0A0D7A6V7_9AGAR|nr:hypothetical protein FISHEDRAFT_75954 [Fistulina hepatica ATCC 64428]
MSATLTTAPDSTKGDSVGSPGNGKHVQPHVSNLPRRPRRNIIQRQLSSSTESDSEILVGQTVKVVPPPVPTKPISHVRISQTTSAKLQSKRPNTVGRRFLPPRTPMPDTQVVEKDQRDCARATAARRCVQEVGCEDYYGADRIFVAFDDGDGGAWWTSAPTWQSVIVLGRVEVGKPVSSETLVYYVPVPMKTGNDRGIPNITHAQLSRACRFFSASRSNPGQCRKLLIVAPTRDHAVDAIAIAACYLTAAPCIAFTTERDDGDDNDDTPEPPCQIVVQEATPTLDDAETRDSPIHSLCMRMQDLPSHPRVLRRHDTGFLYLPSAPSSPNGTSSSPLVDGLTQPPSFFALVGNDILNPDDIESGHIDLEKSISQRHGMEGILAAEPAGPPPWAAGHLEVSSAMPEGPAAADTAAMSTSSSSSASHRSTDGLGISGVDTAPTGHTGERPCKSDFTSSSRAGSAGPGQSALSRPQLAAPRAPSLGERMAIRTLKEEWRGVLSREGMDYLWLCTRWIMAGSPDKAHLLPARPCGVDEALQRKVTFG